MYTKGKMLIIICILLFSAIILYLAPLKDANVHDIKTEDVNLEFYKENITIAVSKNNTVVNGLYYFTCNEQTDVSLFYPFPVDSSHEYPYAINVKELDKGNVPFRAVNNGIIFNLSLDADETKVVNISYTQTITTNNTKYILTTTKTWKKGLTEAEYVINVPKSLKNLHISYQPDEIHEEGTTTIYIIKKENFMPTKDINISWD